MNKKEFTIQQALELHNQMWSDMQKELGDNPTAKDRRDFKERWCYKKGYYKTEYSCFLCQYVSEQSEDCNPGMLRFQMCKELCPINWKELEENGKSYVYSGTCMAKTKDNRTPLWAYAPISKILALSDKISLSSDIKKIAYRKYQLDWLMISGYSIYDVLTQFTKYFIDTEDTDKKDVTTEDICDWEAEQGLNGSLYVCFDEFLTHEYNDREYMQHLLNEEEYHAYLQDIDKS